MVNFCFSRLPDDGTPVPKHGGADTHHELYFVTYIPLYFGARGGVVVKALRYKPAGHGFDPQWCNWNFSVTLSLRSHYGPGVDSTSNRNEYQVYFLGVKAAGA